MYSNHIVSVILPVYNGEQFVSRAIESVLNQTYKELELIVVDDGSSDNSLDVVQSYADSRLKVFTKENGGPASARNLGIQHCSGEYIALIDQDDLWYPTKLQKQVATIHRKNCALVHCDALSIYEDGSRPAQTWSVLYPPKSGRVFRELWHQNFVLSSSAIFRKSIISKVGLLSEDHKCLGVDDKEYWLRIALKYEIGYVHEVLVERSIHKTNFGYLNRRTRAMMHRNGINVKKEYYYIAQNKISKREMSNAFLDQVPVLLYNRLFFLIITNICQALIFDKSNVINIYNCVAGMYRTIYSKILRTIQPN